MAGFANLSRRPLAYTKCPECKRPLATSFGDVDEDGFDVQRCVCGYSELVRSRRYPELWREDYAKSGCDRYLLPWQHKLTPKPQQPKPQPNHQPKMGEILEFRPKQHNT